MFENKKILAVIPARGGSKGVPRKNIKPAGGKPLVAWIIEAAKTSAYIDRLILSSDDHEIIRVAESYECEVPFVRPSELAQDTSSGSDVIIHALGKISGYDYVMLLQPTSPFTSKEDIDGCITRCITSKAKSTVSLTKPDKSPYWMFEMEKNNRLKSIMGNHYLNCRRQDLPSAYIPTGAVYMAESRWFLENKSFYSDLTIGYEIPKERCLDIDTEFDFKLFEFLMKNKPWRCIKK